MKRSAMISLLLLAAVSFMLSGSSCPPVIEGATTTTSTTTTSAGGTTTSTATSTTTTTSTAIATSTTTTVAGETTTTSSPTTTTSTTTTILSGGMEYYPSTDGYSWTFSVVSTGTPEYTGIYRQTFAGTTLEEGATYPKQNREYFYPVGSPVTSSTTEIKMLITSDYVLDYGKVGFPTIPTMQHLAFPLTLNATWEYIPGVVIGVISYESIVVPAGEFSCFKVGLISSNSLYNWYAKNVGLVKYVGSSPTQTVTYELTSKNF